MFFEGIEMAIAVVLVFMIAWVVAMLCRGLGKHTEVNPEFLANMGFWWTVLPVGMISATRYFEPVAHLSQYAWFGVLFGLVPIAASIALRKPEVKADPFFGRDDMGRMSFLGCRPDELVITFFYTLLAFELATIFLWDELYRA